MQMTAHTGYELQAKDLQDMRTLHERFAVDYPAEHAHRFIESTRNLRMFFALSYLYRIYILLGAAAAALHSLAVAEAIG